MMMKDFWNKRYSKQEFIYGETPNEYLKEKLSGMPAGKILFPAEGEGRNAVFAAAQGWEVSAFDQSEEGKKKAEVLADKNGVKIDYRISEVEHSYYPEASFDALVLIFAHFPGSRRKAWHRKLSTFVKKGGRLILEGFSKQHREKQQVNPRAGGPGDLDMLYDLDELVDDFEGFDFIEVYETETELNEGNYHQGKASVIRILATKK